MPLTPDAVGRARTPDGAELAWQSFGTGPGLLLIAGQGASHEGWLPLVPELAASHQVIVFDPRGVGQSTAGDLRPWRTRRLAGDALAVLDDVGIDRAAIYGHSMGGRIAQWLAIDHPERVTRLVLACTTGGDRVARPRDEAVNQALVSGDVEAMTPYFFSAAYAGAHPEVVRAFFGERQPQAVRRSHYQASSNHDAWSHLHQIGTPTLVVHGGADQVTPPASARRLADSIPGAQLWIEPEGLHCVHLESGETRRRVREFFSP